MNDVSLIGRLAREPELITTDSGTDIAGCPDMLNMEVPGI